MGYQDDRLTRRIEVVESIDDSTTVRGIEIACRLVGQYHIVSFTLNTLGIQREPGLGGFNG